MEGIENFGRSDKRNSKVECFYSLDQFAFDTFTTILSKNKS